LFLNQEVVGFFGFSLTPLSGVKRNPNSIFFESLILAQDERWRRALGMQVERLCEAQDFSLSIVHSSFIFQFGI